MTTAREVISYLESQFPENLRAPWDSTDGLIQGNLDRSVSKIVLTLELRENIINNKPDMIILHHPPIFGKDRKITNPFYKKIKGKDIIIYCIHSRADKLGIMNKAIAQTIFKTFNIKEILEDGTTIVELPHEMELNQLLERIKESFNIRYLNYIRKKDKVKLVAIHGGEGFQNHHVELASRFGIDTYLGGDLTHHLAENAHFYQINFIDILHFTEQEGLKLIMDQLSSQFPNIRFEYYPQNPLWEVF